MTATSSTSQSTIPLGNSTVSYGPASEVGYLVKTAG
ncbi:hypothetical protein SAMN05428945_5491 [Streptomyces sp. 2224.1]|nr:hypothetical protein BX261_7043 [Streptomyces sp. 2321.6]SDQ67737.1 hypothetical protein SAMN05216511_0207 [Streptomyces sp. KS_16]SED77864.1 hypothetical protein SAMN05428945_5491 [Streptomyces sp. 2224.1]SNC74100.1 hypothetical protein SAMN06272741_6973 [Streptomyces sp. 2114.4]